MIFTMTWGGIGRKPQARLLNKGLLSNNNIKLTAEEVGHFPDIPCSP